MLDSSHDYKKRDCQLPPGCKDLNDVLKLEKIQQCAEATNLRFWQTQDSVSKPKSPFKGMTIELEPTIMVKDLAQLLSVKPLILIADLLALGVFANLNEMLNFDTAAKLFAKYGVFVKRII